MADSTSSVHITGIVLGSLMFQHLNCDSDVEGLILGESKAEERSNITDSQADQIQLEETIYIQKHITCSKTNSFYNGVGEINQDIIRHLLSDNKQEDVIGWYRQRRNTEQQLTFREQMVHENLKKVLSNPELLFLLLTPTGVTESGSTHRLEYAVFRSHGRRFHNVPLLVNNLASLDQQDYWKFSAPCSSVGYRVAVQRHRSRFFSSEGSLKEVDDISIMNDSLLSELQTACRGVEQSERAVEKLLAEVSTLRKRVTERRGRGGQKKEINAAAVPDENVLLCEAIKAVLPGLPLYQQTAVTLRGFPASGLRCTADHGIDIAATLPLILNPKLHHPKRGAPGRGVLASRKRHLLEPPPVRSKKKRIMEDTEESPPSVTGSETEDDFKAGHNGNVDISQSPVF